MVYNTKVRVHVCVNKASIFTHVKTAPLDEEQNRWLKDDAEVEGVFPRFLPLHMDTSLPPNRVWVLWEENVFIKFVAIIIPHVKLNFALLAWQSAKIITN